MGNDYCTGIRISGCNNKDKLFELFVLNECNYIKFCNYLIGKNKDADKIIYYIPENFCQKLFECKKMYLNADVIDPSIINIEYKLPDSIQLYKFLNTLNFNKDVNVNINTSLKNNFTYFKKCIIINKNISKEKLSKEIMIKENTQKENTQKHNIIKQKENFLDNLIGNIMGKTPKLNIIDSEWKVVNKSIKKTKKY
jgi:hypothetical protein